MRFRCLLACTGLLLSLSAYARVFLLEQHAHGAASAGRPGWTGVYEANMRVNGAVGTVEVLGVEASPAEARAVLEQAYRSLGMDVVFMRAGALAWGVAFDSERVVRFLVLAFSPGRECLVFRMDQTQASFQASLERPREHRITAVPLPPGGHVRFHAANEDVGLQVEMSESDRSPRDVAGYYSARMPAEGWTRLTPQPADAPAVQGLMYRKGNRMAFVHVHDAGFGRTHITRIVQNDPGV